MKSYIPLFFIILLASLFRFIYLDIVPNAIGGDELHYINTAKSLWNTGSDVTGTWNPLSLIIFRYPPNEHQAELPFLIHLLFTAPYPNSLLNYRIPFALLSVGSVVLLYLIAKLLFNTRAAIFTGLVAAFNPWLIIMGRTGYEAMPATFFYLLSFYLLLILKSTQILLVSIPLLAAFYSYIATKVVFIPFVTLISFLAYQRHTYQFKKQYLSLIAFSSIVTLFFFLSVKSDPAGSRLGDIYLPFSASVAQDVNSLRKLTISSRFTPYFINKFTVYSDTIISKIFRMVSPSYLLVDGDQFFLPVRHGFFYYIDIVLFTVGIIVAYRKFKKTAIVLLLLSAVGIIPHLVNTTKSDFSIHLTMMFPILLIIIGLGASVLKKSIVIVVILYGIQILSFSETYFYRYPLVGHGEFPIRILSQYLRLIPKDTQAIVLSPLSHDTLQKHIFYSNSFTFQNVQFLACDTLLAKNDNSIIVKDSRCGAPLSMHHNSITSLSDAGELYSIENDLVCNVFNLKPYASQITLGDFRVEKLDKQRFCETHISQR